MTTDIAIAYNGGAYGTYMHWLLTTLTSHNAITDPFEPNGSSHGFKGQGFGNIEQFFVADQLDPIIRVHPKNSQWHSLSENMNKLCDRRRTIYIYPDENSVVLVVNNWLSKVWSNWWKQQFVTGLDKNLLYQNWPVDAGTDIDQIPLWIQREFLSHYLMPAWFDQVEWFHPDHWQHPNCLIVSVGDLLRNFETTMHTVLDFLKLETVRTVPELVQFHEKNLSMQKFFGQDCLARCIVDSATEPWDHDWHDIPVPLATQAWIQWQLRNLGWEIRCDGLDIWPGNSVELQKLLYQP